MPILSNATPEEGNVVATQERKSENPLSSNKVRRWLRRKRKSSGNLGVHKTRVLLSLCFVELFISLFHPARSYLALFHSSPSIRKQWGKYGGKLDCFSLLLVFTPETLLALRIDARTSFPLFAVQKLLDPRKDYPFLELFCCPQFPHTQSTHWNVHIVVIAWTYLPTFDFYFLFPSTCIWMEEILSLQFNRANMQTN